jgi:hypothetical protein
LTAADQVAVQSTAEYAALSSTNGRRIVKTLCRSRRCPFGATYVVFVGGKTPLTSK